MLPMLAGLCCWLAWTVAFPVAAGAEVVDTQVMLAQNARVILTRADVETELARRVPEEHRAEFASSPRRIAELLNMLLVRRTLAAEAREAGLDREPLPQGTGADEDAILSQRLLKKLDAEAGADFDRRIELFAAKAHEDYLVNRGAYMVPERVELSQIFVDTEKRGEEAALGLDPTLAMTVFAMKQIGEISDVTRTRNGYTVVRLDAKRPARQQTFDEVRDQLLSQLKQAHVDARRAAKADAIVADPKLRVNQLAIDALVSATDPEAVRRALQAVPPSPPPN